MSGPDRDLSANGPGDATTRSGRVKPPASYRARMRPERTGDAMREGRLLTDGATRVAVAEADAVIDRALAAVREHLDMPIAYLSEFVGEDAVFRHVDAPGLEALIKAGDSRALDEVYCRHILDGRLPNLIPDTSAFEICRDLPITAAAPIGSHVSVPIHRPDGSVYGMFCCLSPIPNPTLNARDLKVMQMFAGLAAEQIGQRLIRNGDRSDAASRTRAMLETGAFDIVYQPIYRLCDGALASFEALCRFRSDPYRTPDLWFADAKVAGLQPDLEVAVIEVALDAVDRLPPGVRLAVNAAPDTVATGRLGAVFDRAGADRVTLEITEHEQSADLQHLTQAVDALRARGTLIAVDDVGAGYSGLHQILKLRPDILKLDMSLVSDIDADPARRALANAMVGFAAGTGARLTAEGIERAEEHAILRAIGIDYGQGWLLGRPGAIEAAATDAGIATEAPGSARSQRPAISVAGDGGGPTLLTARASSSRRAATGKARRS